MGAELGRCEDERKAGKCCLKGTSSPNIEEGRSFWRNTAFPFYYRDAE